MLGSELALRGHRVALIDRDQGRHLTRVFNFYPPPTSDLVLGEDPAAALRILDTAPEPNAHMGCCSRSSCAAMAAATS
jgi:cellulose biosynthesis protein BcsQ